MFVFVFGFWLLLMALDAGRFHWTSVPPSLQGAGASAMLAAMWTILLPFGANPFLIKTVKACLDSGQRLETCRKRSLPLRPASPLFRAGDTADLDSARARLSARPHRGDCHRRLAPPAKGDRGSRSARECSRICGLLPADPLPAHPFPVVVAMGLRPRLGLNPRPASQKPRSPGVEPN